MTVTAIFNAIGANGVKKVHNLHVSMYIATQVVNCEVGPSLAWNQKFASVCSNLRDSGGMSVVGRSPPKNT